MNHTLALSQEDVGSGSDYQADEQFINQEINSNPTLSDSVPVQEIEPKLTDGLTFIDGYYYYLENGSLYRGFKQIDGKTYFFSRIDGRMRTGMFDIDGYTYYFNANGEMQTGLQHIILMQTEKCKQDFNKSMGIIIILNLTEKYIVVSKQ